MQSHSPIELDKYYSPELLEAFKKGGFPFAKVSAAYLMKNPAAKSRVMLLRALFDIRERPTFSQYDEKYKELLTALPANKELLLAICQALQKQGYCTAEHYDVFAQLLSRTPASPVKKNVKIVKKQEQKIDAISTLFENMPNEVLSQIAEHLSKKDLGRLRQVSKFFAENPELLHVQLAKNHPPLLACGEFRAYFLCDNGSKIMTKPYQEANTFDELKFPEQTHVRQIAVGLINSYGVSQEGQLFQWRNQGLPALRKNDGVPMLFPLPRVIDAAQVAVGQFAAEPFVIIRTRHGGLYAFGNNSNGQLGVSAETVKTKMYRVNLDKHIKVRDVAAGAFHAICCSREGAVYGWGNKNARPRLIEMPLTCQIIRVSASLLYSLALSEKGEVFGWNDQTKPQQIEIPGKARILHIEAGREYSLCLAENGQVFSWKNNYYQALPLLLPDNVKASNIATSGQFSLITTSDGKVYKLDQALHPSIIPDLHVENDCLKMTI